MDNAAFLANLSTLAETDYPLTPPPDFNIIAALAPRYFALLFELILTGVIIVMMIEYLRYTARQDRPFLRIFVVWVVFLCLLKTAECIATAWQRLIWTWGNYRRLKTGKAWYISLDNLIGAIIVLHVQGFFVARLNVLLKQWRVVLIPIVLFMLVTLGAQIGRAYKSFHLESQDHVSSFEDVETAALIGMIGADLLLTFALLATLLKSRTGIKKTDSLIKTLIILSWTTATIPSICCIFKTALYLAFLSKSSVYVVFMYMESKLYVLSMLITLNIRMSLRSNVRYHSGYDDDSTNRMTLTGLGQDTELAHELAIAKSSSGSHHRHYREGTRRTSDTGTGMRFQVPEDGDHDGVGKPSVLV